MIRRGKSTPGFQRSGVYRTEWHRRRFKLVAGMISGDGESLRYAQLKEQLNEERSYRFSKLKVQPSTLLSFSTSYFLD